MDCWISVAIALVVLLSNVVGHPTLSTSAEGNESADDGRSVEPITFNEDLWRTYGLNTSAEWKYFYEPGSDDILHHYDVRFFKGVIDRKQKQGILSDMVGAYLSFFNENGLETWIAHGSLLGWWWNGKILPWDEDVDVQVSETTLMRLIDHFNHTSVEHKPTPSKAKRKYLLDINPWARSRETGMGFNIIDGRWIDTGSGLYVDITVLRKVESQEEPGWWRCKNDHRYKTEDLYPLRKTNFEGVSTKVPFRYSSVLIEEYTTRALAVTKFHDHKWSPDRAEWVFNGQRSKPE